MSVKFDDLLKEQLQDPEIKKEYIPVRESMETVLIS